jgi:uncharacterized membrane protein
VAAFALVCAVAATAPRTAASGVQIADSEALRIVAHHCASCHARTPTHPGFAEAPKQIRLETLAELRQYAPLVLAQAVQSNAMPLGNETRMSADERTRLGSWLRGRP